MTPLPSALSTATTDDRGPGTESKGEPAPAAGIPRTHKILSWMYVGRLCLAAAIFSAVAWIWKDAPPRTTLAVSLILVATSAFTAASFWYTHVLRRRPGESILYGQVVFDAFLVTGAIHLTGGGESTFAPLYILVICAAAVMLPLLGGLLVGLLSSMLYFTDIVVGHHSTLTGGVMLQIGLFAVVAVVTGILGDRLRQTGAALGQVETELRLLRLDTDDILGGISTGILTVDGGGHLMYLNPAAAELLSLPASQWLGKPVLEVLDRIAPGMGAAIGRSAETRKPIRRYETDEIQNGSLILGMSTTLLERGGEEDPPVTAIFQDITERKRIDTLRRRAERLEAIAELSASLAHEIKNPLASIRSAVEQLADGRVDPDDKRLLEVLVVRESDRVSRLLADFLDFARVKVTDPQPIDLSAVVGNVIALVRAHPDAAERDIEAPPSPAVEQFTISGDEDLLHRAVFNLVLNAAQWAGKGGRVEVVLDVLDSDILSPSFGASQVIRLSVRDSGPGVPPEVIEQIFDPFFTMRPGGTGLGLALVQRAVDAHGGAIFVDAVRPPETSGGAFSLYLPARPVDGVLAVNTTGSKELFA